MRKIKHVLAIKIFARGHDMVPYFEAKFADRAAPVVARATESQSVIALLSMFPDYFESNHSLEITIERIDQPREG